MEINKMWDNFQKTGSIYDYIQYAKQKNAVFEEKYNETNIERDSNKGNIYQ